jgi:hypothetical protein
MVGCRGHQCERSFFSFLSFPASIASCVRPLMAKAKPTQLCLGYRDLIAVPPDLAAKHRVRS